MPFLASDVMDQAVIFLNDTARTFYTNTTLIPYVALANERLEKLLLTLGAPQQRIKSTAISVTAGALTLSALPSDFLLPIRLFERPQNGTDADWMPMHEKTWESETYTQTPYLTYWAFRNNAVYFPGAITNREVLLEYQRQLVVITSANSPEDFILSKNYLSAKTAELVARYIGMNDVLGDGIATREVLPCEYELMQAIVLSQQGLPQRRPRYTSKRLEVY